MANRKVTVPRLEPAKTIIEYLGIDLVEEITGANRTRIYRWMYPRDHGGCNGLIPQSHHQKIIDGSAKVGKPVDPAEFYKHLQQCPPHNSNQSC